MERNVAERPSSRRRFLRTGAAAAAGFTALQATGGGAAQMDAYGGYLADEGTWGGTTTDASDQDEVTVRVGTEGNGGNLAFGPAAIYISPGTTITWEWTGEDSPHNAEHDQEADQETDEKLFESEYKSAEGATFEHTFEDGDQGFYPYFCEPHKALEMKGVVVVGEEAVQTELVEYELAETDSFSVPGSVWAGAGIFGGVSVIGVAAYNELVNGYDDSGGVEATSESETPATEETAESESEATEDADASDEE